MLSLPTATKNLNIFWTNSKLTIQDNANGNILYSGVPFDNIFEIYDVLVEDKTGAADVTVFYRAKDTQISSIGIKSETYFEKRAVKADLVTL